MMITFNWLFTTSILLTSAGAPSPQGFEHFITRRGDTLYDGDKVYRFISFNVPCLHYIEDDMAFDRTMPFRFPDPYEIEDALETLQQMGGQVARTYTLSVRRSLDADIRPVHVLDPGQFNEEAFVALDHCLALANKHQIRLIIPLVNGPRWWGGADAYAAFHDKPADAFYTDPQCREDFQKTIAFVVNRVNTVTSVPYKEDKALLAWETANEPTCPPEWTSFAASAIKAMDTHHLVLDGFASPRLRPESLEDPAVDIVQTHHYEKNAPRIIQTIQRNRDAARGKKPYILGEFGFVTTAATRAILDTVIEEDITGALIWSLRRHYKDGGFFWHHEPGLGGDFFKAYHWPGFPSGEHYDETRLMMLMREKAFAIRGLPVPALEPPAAPYLLPIRDVGAISWRGSAGAASYRIERSESSQGSWDCIAYDVSDAQVQYHPLFCDQQAEIGKRYHYRVIARNQAGQSTPSNIVGPVTVKYHTLVDEFQNLSRLYHHSANLILHDSEARKFKEDCHRLGGPTDSFLIYCVPGPGRITGINLYAFAPEQDTDFAFFGSADGQTYQTIRLVRTDYLGGSNYYGYWIPSLYHTRELPEGTRYFKIQFKSQAQLSRMELAYTD